VYRALDMSLPGAVVVGCIRRRGEPEDTPANEANRRDSGPFVGDECGLAATVCCAQPAPSVGIISVLPSTTRLISLVLSSGILMVTAALVTLFLIIQLTLI